MLRRIGNNQIQKKELFYKKKDAVRFLKRSHQAHEILRLS